jgi:hypothetical protein
VTLARLALIGLAAAASLAAAPSGSFVITPGQQLLITQPSHAAVAAVPNSVFTAAPTPNRDAQAPLGPRASNAATVAPSLFTRKEQYRGDGFSPNSTAQDSEERHYMPGAGLSVSMPIQ